MIIDVFNEDCPRMGRCMAVIGLWFHFGKRIDLMG